MSNPQHRYALKPGYRIHWYEIREILGKGGFGITYLAHDLNLDKPVAIKEYLPTEFAFRESDNTVSPVSEETRELFGWGLDRFIKEARTLSRFEHPNIVRVYAVFEENNTGYMVMAYEHGQSLKRILDEQQTLSEAKLLEIFLPILNGLEQVHNQGFIHRDIKPDNIYVREDGSPVLLDFGSARQSLGSDQTMTSLITPGYAPFEQYYSKGEEQGPWTDIYSLGATLYRAVTGFKLNDAIYRSRVVLEQHVESQETAVQQAKGHYTDHFLSAIDHAIQVRPQDRPQSVSQWFDELQQGNLTQIHHRGTPVSKMDAQTDKANRKKMLWLGLGSVVVAMMMASLYFFTNSNHAVSNAAPQTLTIANNEPKSIPQPQFSNPELKSEPEKHIPEQELNAPIITLKKEKPIEHQKETEAIQQAKLLKDQQQKEAQRQAELKRIAVEKAAAERLAEEQRRLKQQLLEQKRLEQQRLQEKERQTEIEQKIALSNRVLESRMATSMDIFGFSDYKKAEKLSLTQQQMSQLNVPGSAKQWLSSGVQMERGKTYRITASGTWKMGKLCNKTDATGEGMYTMGCWDTGKKTIGGYSHGALIGKIGKEGLAFYVGPQFEFTTGKEGTLYLLSNDAAAFMADNSGELSVQVKLIND